MSAALLETCSEPALAANELPAGSHRPERVPLSLETSRTTMATHTFKARRVNDACRALGISRATLYKLAAQGKIRFIKIAGRSARRCQRRWQ